MIKMIAGVYGLPVKQATGKIRVVGMGPNSGPFSIDPDREADLVKKGIAVYVEGELIPSEAPEVLESVMEEVEPVEAPEVEPEIEAEKPLEEMTAKELRELGEEYGLTFKASMKKSAMIEALEGVYPVNDDEDAPSFDAAEAVL